MTETIIFRSDTATEHALDVLTQGGVSRSAAIRQAVLEAAERRERGAQMRRAVLRVPLGDPDGVSVANQPARSLDAIHLATALRIRERLTSFVSYDSRLSDAAALAGLGIDAPE
jgi:predicted nucleic acid-binding protein